MKTRRFLGLALVLAGIGCSGEPGEPTSDAIRLTVSGEELVLTGLSLDGGGEDADTWFEVRTAEGAARADLPPVAGTFRIEPDGLHFTPRYALAEGLEYVWVGTERVASLGLEKGRRFSVTVPAEERSPSTEVVAIRPASDVLPENLLRFYVEFSAPMSFGEAYDRISLVDERGSKIEDVFLELPQELWDSSRTRFTLLFEPGRIKRGLVPHAELGPPLVDGGRYELRIDGAWRDGEGAPLVSGFTKRFSVGPADRTSPDPRQWKLSAPKPKGRDALRVEFLESLDHALAHRCLKVFRDGRSVKGVVTVDETAEVWSFVPEMAWTTDRHEIRILSALEDLAGNNLDGPFDADLGAPDPPRPPDRVVLFFTPSG